MSCDPLTKAPTTLGRRRSSATLAGWLVFQLATGAVAADGVVAVQTAAPSCRDDSGAVYVNCGNGTVTDNRSGLVWLENADCIGGTLDWYSAMQFVAGLADIPAGSVAAADDCGLSDGSSPGDWRLASFDEWEAMVAAATYGGLNCTPVLTDDSGDACWSPQCRQEGDCAFLNFQVGPYWTAETVWFTFQWEVGDLAYYLASHDGGLAGAVKEAEAHLWPVRGGQ